MKVFLWCALVFGILFACLTELAAQSFSFTTPAGVGGQPGTADGTNVIARFREPGGITVDSAGTLYVADTANHTIRRITRAGNSWVTKTIAGSPGLSGTNDGANATARFYYPYGVAVDNSGTLYVADTYNHTIRKIVSVDTNWVVTTLAGSAGVHGSGNGTGTSANFYYPYGLAVDQSGWIYVADSYNHIIRQVSPGGAVVTIAGTAGVTGVINGTNSSAQFYYPSGIAVDHFGNIFLADTYNSMIRQISLIGADWVVTTLAGLPRYSGSADGTNRAAQFNYPFGISVGSSGTLYVADTVNDTLRAATPVGTDWVVTTIGGLASSPASADGPGSTARFYNPYGIAVDNAGNLFIADSYNHTIRYGQPGFILQALLISGQLVLSWPLGASNYVLETSSSLAPGALWSSLGGATISGNNFVKTNSISPDQAFFRLHLQ